MVLGEAGNDVRIQLLRFRPITPVQSLAGQPTTDIVLAIAAGEKQQTTNNT